MDVLGLGAVSVDDVVQLDEFPLPGSKVRVLFRERRPGGLTLGALVAARRMGASAAYAGILGSDEGSRFVESFLQAEGVDISRVVRREDAGPSESVILLVKGDRTVLSHVPRLRGASPDGPPEQYIRQARVLLVDHVGVEGQIRAAQIASQAGIPVVGDIERLEDPGVAELLRLVDHLIVPLRLARELTGADDVAEAVSRLAAGRVATVATCGAEGCWFAEGMEPGRVRRFPAFRVRTVDSTGCGDCFHGAYAALLASGAGVEERIRTASACAALKASRWGGPAAFPSAAEVQAFLAGQDACTEP
ncbi:MAG: permease [Armatimonadota bacterium]|nr:MAG: permease [Armatimonadota bacterium]